MFAGFVIIFTSTLGEQRPSSGHPRWPSLLVMSVSYLLIFIVMIMTLCISHSERLWVKLLGATCGQSHTRCRVIMLQCVRYIHLAWLLPPWIASSNALASHTDKLIQVWD